MCNQEFLDANPGTFVFVGQAMRPLYEATIGIYGLQGGRPRKKFRYFVMPNRDMIRRNPEILRAQLKKIIRAKSQFYVVDFSYRSLTYANSTFYLVSNAIKSINPGANVMPVNQNHPLLGTGIKMAEHIPRPVGKDIHGKLRTGEHSNTRFYLLFQKELTRHLRQMQQAQPRKIA